MNGLRQVAGSPSYFELPRKQRQSSSSFEKVSPLSDPVSKTIFSQRKLRRPCLSHDLRSYSDNGFLHNRFNVIEQDFATCHSSPSRTPDLIRKLDNVPEQDLKSRQFDQSSSQSWDHAPGSMIIQTDQLLQSNASSTESSTGRTRQTQSVTQPRSRAILKKFRTDTSSSIYETASLREKRQQQDHARVASLPIQPLRPPSVSTKYSEPLLEHSVRIEQPFTDSLIHVTQEPRVEIEVQRRNSINPKHIFSVSVDAFRKMSKKPAEPTASLLEGQLLRPQLLSTNAPDHQTSLRRQQTGFGLARVTSMLQEMKKLDLKAQTSTERPTLAVHSNGTSLSPRHEAPMSHHFRDRVKSMEMGLEDTDSHSSSLARMKMGPMPNNTPDEKATYTIINQDGKLEEFLKVDISVRGQTSYLPSEARRIHTPPLPAEGRDGRKRGFFFDYAMAKESSIHGSAIEPITEIQGAAIERSSSNLSIRPSRANTTSRRLTPTVACNGARVKQGDWYDTQLAKFESLSLSDDHRLSPQISAREEYTVASFEQEQQRLENEEQLDHNIPEHLPTSPLCPRHPRYWRVVKNKGSQFRGC